jgi:hypothetical protein
MGKLILPNRRLERPASFRPNIRPVGPVDVDLSHPILKDALAVVIGGNRIEPVTGGLITPVFDVNEEIRTNQYGQGFYCGNNAKWKVTPKTPTDIGGNRNITYFAITSVISSTQSYGGIIGNLAGAGRGASGLVVEANADDLRLSEMGTDRTAITLVDDTTYCVYGRYNTAVSNSAQAGGHIFQQGLSTFGSGAGSASSFNFPTDLYLGGDHRFSTSRYIEQIVHLGLIINRYLSQSEINSLALDPDQFLIPK